VVGRTLPRSTVVHLGLEQPPDEDDEHEYPPDIDARLPLLEQRNPEALMAVLRDAGFERVRSRRLGEIDRIDRELVDLIGERFTYVDRAWQLKNSPAEARVPWRIQQVIDKVKARATEKRLPPELVEALWRQMIGWFIQYEEEKLRQAEPEE